MDCPDRPPATAAAVVVERLAPDHVGVEPLLGELFACEAGAVPARLEPAKEVGLPAVPDLTGGVDLFD